MRIIILAISFLMMVSCKNDAQKNTAPKETQELTPEVKKETTPAGVTKTFGNVSIEEAKEMIATNPDLVIVDVRTPMEIERGKIEGALEMDFNADDFKKKLAFMDKKKDYLVYCQSGIRSAKCMDMMRVNGFVSVKNMIGGYNEWTE